MRTTMHVFRCRNRNDGWVVGGPGPDVDWICFPTWGAAMECANAVGGSKDPQLTWQAWTLMFRSRTCHTEASSSWGSMSSSSAEM